MLHSSAPLIATFHWWTTNLQISDVVLQDATTDTGARNVRRLCALYAGPTSGFEIVHGLADRLMQLVQVCINNFTTTQQRTLS
jgi:phenylalanyl-tRNA synthetase beta subunit